MEAVVDQPLGDIVDRDAGRVLERPQVDDAFMGDAIVAAAEQQRIVALQPAGDVVGIEDRDLVAAVRPSPPIISI